jgi:phosphoadenosine phosphosulfate reductase
VPRSTPAAAPAAARPDPGSPALDELHAAARELESAHPTDIIKWAHERFGDLVVTASFEDAVLPHLAATAVPGIEIAILDTQYLFAETWWLTRKLGTIVDLNLRIIAPAAGVVPDDRWATDIEGCCHVRKVEPLNRLLAGRTGWVTGIRRVDGPTRANAPVVTWDLARHLVKINPLAMWTDDDMALYARLNDLPANPLSERGYPSIGCWPCTRPVAPGEDKRAGRWSGSNKTECGLHV